LAVITVSIITEDMFVKITSSKNILFDFDGVIKESIKSKSEVFVKLFSPFGNDIVELVQDHHEAHGGMSRFEKLPIYIKWTGQEVTQKLINKYAEIFSLLVKQKVIDSDWVDGVLEYLKQNYQRQQFFIVTATPQQEIEEILGKLKITDYFKQVFGSPINKDEAIKFILDKYKINRHQTVMIGDSRNDYKAATENQIPFILRKTWLNRDMQEQLNCQMIKNFENE
jgi:phosphoglycolate phosphatase-like HAD superfamily hydrolase